MESATVRRARVEEGQADCLAGGWQRFERPSFADQGACVSYFATPRGGGGR